jgi:catechol 2,3-dioxygenase-like lactoylglutathione lyase family enzyme
MKRKISMITLGVRDITRSLNFYRSLNFQTHNYKDDDQMVMFELEGTWLGLYPRDLLAEDANVANEGQGFAAFTMAHNVKKPKWMRYSGWPSLRVPSRLEHHKKYFGADILVISLTQMDFSGK